MSLKEEQLSSIKTGCVCLHAYDKGLCYQTVPFLMEHKLGGNRAVLVVSSLIALIKCHIMSKTTIYA